MKKGIGFYTVVFALLAGLSLMWAGRRAFGPVTPFSTPEISLMDYKTVWNPETRRYRHTFRLRAANRGDAAVKTVQSFVFKLRPETAGGRRDRRDNSAPGGETPMIIRLDPGHFAETGEISFDAPHPGDNGMQNLSVIVSWTDLHRRGHQAETVFNVSAPKSPFFQTIAAGGVSVDKPARSATAGRPLPIFSSRLAAARSAQLPVYEGIAGKQPISPGSSSDTGTSRSNPRNNCSFSSL